MANDAELARTSILAPRRSALPWRRIARPGDRYSRFVALMKLLLPALAMGLVLLIAAWPRIEQTVSKIHISLPRIDMRDARDLQMVNARYSGIDRHHRPYVVTADKARQMPNQSDLMSLEGPKADITLNSGAWVALTGDTGVYMTQTQLLDLYGDVKLFHDRGYDLNTDSAHVDLNAGTADGNDAVRGHGAMGDIVSEGFRLTDHGAVIFFTGKAKLHLLPRVAEKS